MDTQITNPEANPNAVHDWFGLTYASYLVLPRVVMQSMPAEWQEKMVALLEECDERLGVHYGANEYRVRLVIDGKMVADPLASYRHLRLSENDRTVPRLTSKGNGPGE